MFRLTCKSLSNLSISSRNVSPSASLVLSRSLTHMSSSSPTFGLETIRSHSLVVNPITADLLYPTSSMYLQNVRFHQMRKRGHKRNQKKTRFKMQEWKKAQILNKKKKIERENARFRNHIAEGSKNRKIRKSVAFYDKLGERLRTKRAEREAEYLKETGIDTSGEKEAEFTETVSPSTS